MLRPPRCPLASGIALALTLFAAAAAAGEEDGAAVSLVTVHQLVAAEPSADPDHPALRAGILGGRWSAMAGGALVLVAGPLGDLRAAVALDGFIELANFTDVQPVPWESFRANVGLDTLWEHPSVARAILPAGGRLHLALGWFHESDHVAAQEAYRADYLRSGPYGAAFDNANFSAYEYVKLRLAWRQPLAGGRVVTQSVIGARLFPPPINPGSVREMRWSFLTEGRVRARLTDAVHPFVSAYYELVENEFVAARHGFRWGAVREPLRYRAVSVGVDLRSAGGAIASPQLVYSSSHGRGVDFPRFHGPELGFALVFTL